MVSLRLAKGLLPFPNTRVPGCSRDGRGPLWVGCPDASPKWTGSTGIGGRFGSELLDGFSRNRWTIWTGIGGRFQPEYSLECHGLSFDERLGLAVDREWTARRDRRLARLIKQALLTVAAAPEGFDYRTSRGIDKPLLRQLLAGDWLRDGRNILLTGPTGVGKTLVCALGNAVCRLDFTTRYYRVPRLLGDVELARADGPTPGSSAGWPRWIS